ncbi:hypothetical protein E2C01_039631 [Portunus trituberculatus]|uniref:Uncharacterized protein n=1 Tax=Portunus trituberculatus TaxID=210409 RepID=A0A5B7FKC5_PORTR|nr:hypothetical protein [Portunus trituberculatus]
MFIMRVGVLPLIPSCVPQQMELSIKFAFLAPLVRSRLLPSSLSFSPAAPCAKGMWMGKRNPKRGKDCFKKQCCSFHYLKTTPYLPNKKRTKKYYCFNHFIPYFFTCPSIPFSPSTLVPIAIPLQSAPFLSPSHPPTHLFPSPPSVFKDPQKFPQSSLCLRTLVSCWSVSSPAREAAAAAPTPNCHGTVWHETPSQQCHTCL